MHYNLFLCEFTFVEKSIVEFLTDFKITVLLRIRAGLIFLIWRVGELYLLFPADFENQVENNYVEENKIHMYFIKKNSETIVY